MGARRDGVRRADRAFVAAGLLGAYVAINSNTLLPLVYRYTAVWGAHEGSLLLWALILATVDAAVALFQVACPTR
jgi:cytochrome c-type biogenesis protein CcmF